MDGSKAAALAIWLAVAAHGTPRCVSCHAAQARSQPNTDMAWALMPPGSNKVLEEHPKLTVRRGAYEYAVETHDGASTYSVTDGSNRMSLPIRWAFGARSQTWVLEYSGRYYESLVSYYAPIGGLDTTIGDASIQPRTLVEAIGRELSDFETQSCFNCHATGAILHDALQTDVMRPGVQCEHCHTGSERHAASFAAGKPETPKKLDALSPEEISNFCGQCHRTWERVVRDRLRGPINVRFQPYRLANSRCYDGGDRRMTCTACHDPHEQVTHGAEAYDSKCLACHSEGASKTRGAKVCRAATGKCSSCHMPKIELPGGHMIFTDHQIRVVRYGEAYPD